MKIFVEARCIVCQLVYCCADCRRRHEETVHGLTYDCPICRGLPFLCKPKQLNQDFILHLAKEHIPLHCKKCQKTFNNMEDISNIDACNSISELVNKPDDIEAELKEVDDKFESLYEKINNNDTENFEGIISVNKSSKTAVITPIIRRKNIVDYDSSDSGEDSQLSKSTPYPKLVSKTPKFKRQRAATPHTKKLLGLIRQQAIEEYEVNERGEDNFNGSPINKNTPSRIESNKIGLDTQKQVTTPTSHLPHLLKLAQALTTSTPTHPIEIGWPLFPDQGADSPLSEIENADSPAQSINVEPSKTDLDVPKLKSIIATGSKSRVGSQDSSEKHVTIQDSNENSIKKRVKFAEDTVFEQASAKRVFRKPKRMLTPGPQKPRFCYNPRFQALINRFENQGLTMARTPTTKDKNLNNQESTPPMGEPTNIPARAINFKDDSPIIEFENTKDTTNELFKTCIDTPEANAISVLTTNIVGGLQNCLSAVLTNSEVDTEIQFKFVITKKKVSVQRIMEECQEFDENASVIERNQEPNKENIWSSVARAVRNVFWGERAANFASTTPHRSGSNSFDSSSSSKRKSDELSDTESPINHKRQKYEGRIRGRPPLRKSRICVASLRTTLSAEQKSLINELTTSRDEAINLSF